MDNINYTGSLSWNFLWQIVQVIISTGIYQQEIKNYWT